MKTIRSLFLATSFVAFSAYASFVPVYIAKPTGAVQCQDVVQSPSDTVQTLGAAINEVEAYGIVVSEALVAYINTELLPCKGCSCPDGTYNVLKVENFENLQSLMNDRDWFMVQENQIEAL